MRHSSARRRGWWSSIVRPNCSALISDIARLQIEPTPLHDQSSCSVLFYEKPGDHIGWHYDHNFYKGRHFTVLIPLINRGREANGLSQARLKVRQNRYERVIPPRQMP